MQSKEREERIGNQGKRKKKKTREIMDDFLF
jgi:hypothetical protein